MKKKIQIDMNSDVGESFGVYKLGLDEEVIPHITSANIACGFPGGDPGVIRKTVSLAKQYEVEVGAHPGFPDLMGFGRRNIDATLEEIQDYIIYQMGTLQAFCLSQGLRLQHVKPHGSLYNMAVANHRIWEGIAEAVTKGRRIKIHRTLPMNPLMTVIKIVIPKPCPQRLVALLNRGQVQIFQNKIRLDKTEQSLNLTLSPCLGAVN